MINEKTIQRAKHAPLLADIASGMRKVAGTGGGEYAGPCPFCGGDDRFHVQPMSSAGPRWFCRHCTDGAWKDAIDFVRRHSRLNFPDAVATLAGETGKITAACSTTVPNPSSTKAPSPAWQIRAGTFVAKCEHRLWSEEGMAALKSLRGRGFSGETIKLAHLGWNHQQCFEDRMAWGLPAELNAQGNPKRVWLPRGWVLPWYIGDELWRVNIRRPQFNLDAGRKVDIADG